jgi:hypothetical protein
MTKPKEEVRTIEFDPNPKGKLRMLGGSRSGKWNLRLLNLVGNLVALDHSNRETSNEATKGCLPDNG